jgi:hypothetical protein
MDLHPSSHTLFSYWDRCRAGRDMPARADFDPLQIPHVMRFLSLIDILPAAPRFRYRLIGTGIVEYFGRDATGLFVDEKAYGASTADALAFYERGAAGTPVRSIWSGRLTPKFSGRFETIVLPLGKDHEHADMLLTLSVRLGPPDVAADAADLIYLHGERAADGLPFEILEVGALDLTS